MSQTQPRLLYATDEDLALRAGADFLLLCPADQAIASAADGAFSASDRWTLTSPSVDFQARGARPGQIIHLRRPASHYGPQGNLLAVESVGPNGLTLRRKGLPATTGQPPAPVGGLTGVDFFLATLTPQLQRASLELDRRFGIDPAIPGRSPSDLADTSALRDAVVLLVLAQQFLTLSRSGHGSESAAQKGQALLLEFENLLPRIPRGHAPGTRFGTRLTR